jgi:predicted component of type VI protein secretion system
MHEETFNLSIRKFLKIVGINSQREIEQAVRKALEEGRIAGNETFPATVTLEVAELNLKFRIDGEIKLQ